MIKLTTEQKKDKLIFVIYALLELDYDKRSSIFRKDLQKLTNNSLNLLISSLNKITS